MTAFRPPVRDDLAELAGYHSPQLDVDVRLNTNESPEPPPPEFSTALAAKVADLDWNRYPDRAGAELRARLADHHRVSSDQVFVANGSNEVLQTLLLTWGGPGRRIMTFEPTYAMQAQIARTTGTEVIEVERNADFGLDVTEAAEAVETHRPIITFVTSPNNPTGMVEPLGLIEALVETVRPFGFVVVDEAYAQFADYSALDLLAEDNPLLVTRTFSKTWAMAAARLGYLIAPSWVVERMGLAVLPYHLDAVSQLAGVTALDYASEMEARVARLVEDRGEIQAGLADLGVEFWPSQSNFILFRPPDGDGAEVWQKLVDAGILVRNCAGWPRLDGCLRVTVGTRSENRAFLAALGAILGSDA